MKEFLDETGKRIYEHLRDEGRTQKWLADQLCVSKTHLSQVLLGNRSLSKKVLNKINEVLGTDFKNESKAEQNGLNA